MDAPPVPPQSAIWNARLHFKATVDIEPPTAPLTAQPLPLQCYGSTFLMETVNAAQRAELAKSNPRDELIGYLRSPPEQTDNILHWWGHNTSRPTLLRMARDYLAIQGLSRAFPRPPNDHSLAAASQIQSGATNSAQFFRCINFSEIDVRFNVRTLLNAELNAPNANAAFGFGVHHSAEPEPTFEFGVR
ncbi:hypothetical protein GGX14DRAFT_399082 [Mycena pura]|uniref:HAT C-terminal dimerisation domain-containing protein n=1 Tax=Mycena pura TaxID=153505 RepID=A0AAD6V5M0_9AGAR|nr:hypothetical protein GGX14DRAFT_399082 [Mycena pura]